MIIELIKVAIEEINKLDSEMKYEVIDEDGENFPKVIVRGQPIEVLADLDQVQSITATNNTLMIFEDGAITILSPVNWTYHQTYL